MRFDRFDIAEAYNAYMIAWNRSGLTPRCHEQGRSISEQLHRLRARNLATVYRQLSENGREIYDALVLKCEGEDGMNIELSLRCES